jgi:hypothetical protein
MNEIDLSIDMSEFSDYSHATNRILFIDEKVNQSYECLLNEQI